MANFTRPTNVTEPEAFFTTYINEQILVGIWGYMIISAVFFTIFLGLMTRRAANPRKAFAAASFTSMLVTVLFLPLNLVGTPAVVTTVVLVVAAIVVNGGDAPV